jgi:peptidoglycan/LPS O-acetylase OafA/YrhL
MNPSASRVPALDGIRGVAISLVVAYHTFYVFGEAPMGSLAARAMATARLWWNGVDLFFVLSGFLIGGILLDAKSSLNYYKVFYIRRAFRILPLYFCVLGAYALCSHHLRAEGQRFPALAYLTLTQNLWAAAIGNFGLIWLACTWSLAIEEQFYLVAPTLIRVTTSRTLSWIVLATVAIAPIFRVALFLAIPHGAFSAHVLMFTRADALMFGVGVALIVRNSQARAAIQENIGILATATLVSGAGMVWFTLRNWTVGSLPMTAVGYSLQAFFYACVILISVLRERGLLARILSVNILRFMGQRAYAIYLFHVPALYLAFEMTGRPPRVSTWSEAGIALSSVLASLILASLSWSFLEKPMLARGRNYQYQ